MYDYLVFLIFLLLSCLLLLLACSTLIVQYFKTETVTLSPDVREAIRQDCGIKLQSASRFQKVSIRNVEYHSHFC